jgi:hypothetical protein
MRPDTKWLTLDWYKCNPFGGNSTTVMVSTPTPIGTRLCGTCFQAVLIQNMFRFVDFTSIYKVFLDPKICPTNGFLSSMSVFQYFQIFLQKDKTKKYLPTSTERSFFE